MSKELREAAERVEVSLIPGSPLTDEATRAAWTLAKAYLAEHPSYDDELHNDPNRLTCKSCGKPFTNHAGIQRTCADLQKAKELIALQDSLLACYRVQKRPPNNWLDRMQKLREDLK